MRQDDLIIDLKDMIERLNKYDWDSLVYINELKKYILEFDAQKIKSLLNRLALMFSTKYFIHDNDDYKKLLLLQQDIELFIEENTTKEKDVVQLMQFWIAINTWIENEMKGPSKLIKDIYKNDFYEYGEHFINYTVDNNNLYRERYGKNYKPINNDIVSIEIVKEFVEAYYYDVFNASEGRRKFTIKVNELFTRFGMPYKLIKGEITRSEYITSFCIDEILNLAQFENKIEYASKMIASNNHLDKHSALKYITDAFSYFKSLYNKKNEIASIINKDVNSEVYKIIKDELEFIGKLINNHFDIRHNEYYSTKTNGEQPIREALKDPIFIEYLYNRINALLSLLRIKHDQEKKVKKNNIEVLNYDEDLPF